MSKTLVFGASLNTDRYSNRAIKRLLKHNIEVVAVGGREGTVEGVEIQTGHPQLEEVDTITMYMGPARQSDHEEYLIGLKPRRIIFNPGAENRHFSYRARAAGILTTEACTLVLLSLDQYDDRVDAL